MNFKKTKAPEEKSVGDMQREFVELRQRLEQSGQSVSNEYVAMEQFVDRHQQLLKWVPAGASFLPKLYPDEHLVQQIAERDTKWKYSDWKSLIPDRLSSEQSKSMTCNSLAITPDGRLLALGSREGDIVLWDLEQKRKIEFEKIHKSAIIIYISDDGRRVASVDLAGQAIAWDVEKRSPIGKFEGDDWSRIAISRDCRKAVSARGSCLTVWDFGHREATRLNVKPSRDASCVSINRDGRRAVSGSRDGFVTTWDIEKGKPIGRFRRDPLCQIYQLLISDDGRQAVSVGSAPWGEYNEICFWDLEERQAIFSFRCPYRFEFSRVGRHVVTNDDAGYVVAWDLEKKKENYLGRHIYQSWVRGGEVSISHDGHLAVSTSGVLGQVFLWDVVGGTVLDQIVFPSKVSAVLSATGILCVNRGGQVKAFQLPKRLWQTSGFSGDKVSPNRICSLERATLPSPVTNDGFLEN